MWELMFLSWSCVLFLFGNHFGVAGVYVWYLFIQFALRYHRVCKRRAGGTIGEAAVVASGCLSVDVSKIILTDAILKPNQFCNRFGWADLFWNVFMAWRTCIILILGPGTVDGHFF